jgi:hypothetical protein
MQQMRQKTAPLYLVPMALAVKFEMPWAESCSFNGRQNEEESQKRFCSLPQDSPFRSAGHFSLPMNHPFHCQISSESPHFIPKFTKC